MNANAPGWYHDGFAIRGWDGYLWGPYAPPSGGENDKTLAILSHLGFVAGGFVVPLVIYLIQQNKQSFVRHHAREALNIRFFKV